MNEENDMPKIVGIDLAQQRDMSYIPPRPLEQYEPTKHDELMAAIRKHLGSAHKVKLRMDLNDPYPSAFAEYKIVPMVLDAESKAYAHEILDWAEKHDYDVAFMDEEKVRDICERMQPVEPIIFYGHKGVFCGSCQLPLASDDYNYCPFCGKKIKKGNEK